MHAAVRASCVNAAPLSAKIAPQRLLKFAVLVAPTLARSWEGTWPAFLEEAAQGSKVGRGGWLVSGGRERRPAVCVAD